MASNSFRVTSRTLSEIALFSALVVGIRLLRIPLHIPGAGSIIWIAIFIIARAYSSYPLISTSIGLISGTVVTLAGIDFPPGPQHFVKYVIAGVTADATRKVIRRESALTYALLGTLISLSKLLSVYVMSYILGIPIIIVKMMLAYVLVLHVVFGAIAGIVAYYVVIVIKKTAQAVQR